MMWERRETCPLAGAIGMIPEGMSPKRTNPSDLVSLNSINHLLWFPELVFFSPYQKKGKTKNIPGEPRVGFLTNPTTILSMSHSLPIAASPWAFGSPVVTFFSQQQRQSVKVSGKVSDKVSPVDCFLGEKNNSDHNLAKHHSL